MRPLLLNRLLSGSTPLYTGRAFGRRLSGWLRIPGGRQRTQNVGSKKFVAKLIPASKYENMVRLPAIWDFNQPHSELSGERICSVFLSFYKFYIINVQVFRVWCKYTVSQIS